MDATTLSKPAQGHALYSQREILARGKFSKSHLYNLMKRGQFPKPALREGTRFTRWVSTPVDNWFEDPQGWITAHADTGHAESEATK